MSRVTSPDADVTRTDTDPGDAMSDVVYEVDRDGIIQWVSQSVQRVLGYTPDEMVGRRALDPVDDEDLPDVEERRAEVLGGETVGGRYRARTKQGEPRWFDARAHPVIGSDGTLECLRVALTDVQAEVLLARALAGLSMAKDVLVRARDEQQLISEMCDVVVERAGYGFAWYGRCADDAAQTVEAIAWSGPNSDYVDALNVSWGDNELGRGPTGTCLRTGIAQMVPDFTVGDACLPWATNALAAGFRSALSQPVVIDGAVDGAFVVYARETNAFDSTAMVVLGEMAAHIGLGLRRLRDTTALAHAAEEQRLLHTAIDQADEAIVLTDADMRIIYANPAASKTSGFGHEELIGHTPSLLRSGVHDESFFTAIDACLARGRTWRGVILNRRKSGELYEEDTSITPVVENGMRVAMIIVKRDLSSLQALDGSPNRAQNDREVIARIMRSIRPGADIHASASSFSRALLGLADVDGAMVMLVHESGDLVPASIDGLVIHGRAVGVPISYEGIDALVQLTARGPWWIDVHHADEIALVSPDLSAGLLAVGVTATAYAPIRWEGRLLGVLSIATASPAAAAWMPGRLALFEELASFAGVLLGAQASRHRRIENLRAELRDIIDHARFHTVFEPIIELASGDPVGFEALTRFDDGRRPDLRFLDADAAGLESELEVACARAAITAARDLPAGTWVSVNFSASALLEGCAAVALQGADRPVVIEITEHMAIQNYQALREALADCGDVQVAVDDAGAGFASLRHILELAPDIVKLDIGLVHDIDTDSARQALVAGMRHFAALTGTKLIAEGVETEAEAAAVGRLGVTQAQGHLFATIVPVHPH
ncbi:MAG: EAL domain-containing protein [Actinomycetota bacterium]